MSTKESLRVSFDMPASTSVGEFNRLLNTVKATNIETRPIGRPRVNGEAPVKANGATISEIILNHIQAHGPTKTSAIQELVKGDYSPSSVSSTIHKLTVDKLLKRIDAGVYGLPSHRKVRSDKKK